MLDVNLDRRLREREVARYVLHFFCTCDFRCEHLENPKECAKIHILAQYYSFSLIEVSTMSGIDFIVSEASCNAEILSRNLGLGQLMCRQYGALTSQHLTSGEFLIELVAPASGTCVSAILVCPGDIAQPRLLNFPAMDRLL